MRGRTTEEQTGQVADHSLLCLFMEGVSAYLRASKSTL